MLYVGSQDYFYQLKALPNPVGPVSSLPAAVRAPRGTATTPWAAQEGQLLCMRWRWEKGAEREKGENKKVTRERHESGAKHWLKNRWGEGERIVQKKITGAEKERKEIKKGEIRKTNKDLEGITMKWCKAQCPRQSPMCSSKARNSKQGKQNQAEQRAGACRKVCVFTRREQLSPTPLALISRASEGSFNDTQQQQPQQHSPILLS